MPWVSQIDRSSDTEALLRRTYYLTGILSIVDDILRRYHEENPDGIDYTQKVFQSLGENRVTGIHQNFNRAKQDIGLLVPQRLNYLFGRERVLTERRNNMRDCASRRNEDTRTQGWLLNYTRHKVSV